MMFTAWPLVIVSKVIGLCALATGESEAVDDSVSNSGSRSFDSAPNSSSRRRLARNFFWPSEAG